MTPIANFFMGVSSFLMARRRIWLPPVVVTLVVFGLLLVFYRSHEGSVFHYRLF